jgi:hypothetical protein
LENTIECLDAEKVHSQQAGQTQSEENFVELRQDEMKIEIGQQPPVNPVAAMPDFALANDLNNFAAPATSTTPDIAQNTAGAGMIRSTPVHGPVNNEMTANSTSLGATGLPSLVANQFSDGLPRILALTSEGQPFVQADHRGGSKIPAANSSIYAQLCSLPAPGDTPQVSPVDQNFLGKQAFVPSPRMAAAIQQPQGRPTKVDVNKQNLPQSSPVIGKSLADRITFKDSRSASPNINDREFETRKRRLDNGDEVQAKKPNLGSNHSLRSSVPEERALSRSSTTREPESSNVGWELLPARALEPPTGPPITPRYDHTRSSARKGYTFPIIHLSQIERIFGADLRTGFYYQRIPFDDLPMIAIINKIDQPHMPRGERAGGTYYTALQPARDIPEHFPVLVTSSAGKYHYAGDYTITESKIVPSRQANEFSPEMKWNLVRSLYYTHADGKSIMREEHIKELVTTGVCRTELEARKILIHGLFKRLLKIEVCYASEIQKINIPLVR